MTETKEARQARVQRSELVAEVGECVCRACKGHGKRIVPNSRERGIPPQDFGPGFYTSCPDCRGTGKALLPAPPVAEPKPRDEP